MDIRPEGAENVRVPSPAVHGRAPAPQNGEREGSLLGVQGGGACPKCGREDASWESGDAATPFLCSGCGHLWAKPSCPECGSTDQQKVEGENATCLNTGCFLLRAPKMSEELHGKRSHVPPIRYKLTTTHP